MTGRLAPEWVDARGLVAVFAEGLEEVRGARDEGEEAGVGFGGLVGRAGVVGAPAGEPGARGQG